MQSSVGGSAVVVSAEVLAVLAEVRRLGIQLRVNGGILQYRPVGKLPPDLAERIKVNRGEVLAALGTLDRDGSPENAPRGSGPRRSDAAQRDGLPDGGKRFEGQNAPIPVRWVLDDIDRRVLLQCGILPTPGPDELPEPWRTGYRRQADRLVKIGVHREEAEAVALAEVLRRMLAAGELELPEGW